MLEHLRGLREDKDLSQQALAELMHIHQTTYSEYERGVTNIPQERLIWLAVFFETSVDYLLELTDERTPYPRRK